MEMGRLPPTELPSLIRADRHAGDHVHGDPAWNPWFGTANFSRPVAVDNVNRCIGPHSDLSPNHAA